MLNLIGGVVAITVGFRTGVAVGNALRADWWEVNGNVLSSEGEVVETLTIRVPLSPKGHPSSDALLWAPFWLVKGAEKSVKFSLNGEVHEVFGPRHPHRLETRTVSSRYAE